MDVIIVDDEVSAQEVLSTILEMNHPEVQVVDCCSDVVSALASIRKHKPAAVFLDIEMPGGSGFDLFNHLDELPTFDIIFVTAYDHYAIRAFEVAALDYLLKPVDEERLAQAISRVEQRSHINDIEDRIATLTKTLDSNTVENITVYQKGERYLIPISEIIAVQAQGAYCNIFTCGHKEEMVISKNLRKIELIIDGNPNFFRSHRSWIVNTSKLISYSKLNGTITLEKGVIAKLSQYKFDDFEGYLSSK